MQKRYHDGFHALSGNNSVYSHLRRVHGINQDGTTTTLPTNPFEAARLLSQAQAQPTANSDFGAEAQRFFSFAFPDRVICENLSFEQATSKDTRTQFQLLGVVGHLIDQAHIKRTLLLAMPRILGGHNGGDLAVAMLGVADRFEIRTQLGCFVTDNAGDNDTVMAAIGRDIRTVTESKRLRCADHIINLINLVIKSILQGARITDLTKEKLWCSVAAERLSCR